MNISSHQILKQKKEFEELINGSSITKKIKPGITYKDVKNGDDLYSFLLFYGYLKVEEQVIYEHEGMMNVYRLVIPNKEVKQIYIDIFDQWFKTYSKSKGSQLLEALLNDEKDAEKLLRRILRRSISYFDYKESFYHGFMTGIFENLEFDIESNREHGNGRPDLVLMDYDGKLALVIEMKYARDASHLEAAAKQGINQIIERSYLEEFKEDYDEVRGYSIAFYKKNCLILSIK